MARRSSAPTRWSPQVEKAIHSNPANADVISFTGFDFLGGGFRNNAATIFVTQIPWDERKVTAPQLVGELFGKTAGIKEALVLAFNPPPIFGLGTAGGYEFYIQNRGDGGAKRLTEVTQQFLQRANQRPAARRSRRRCGARPCRSSTSTSTARRRRSSACRSTTSSARSSATLGNYYVNDFNKYGRAWQVLMSAEPAYRSRPDDIGAVYVRSDQGRDDSARRRSRRSVIRRARIRSTASTTCRR